MCPGYMPTTFATQLLIYSSRTPKSVTKAKLETAANDPSSTFEASKEEYEEKQKLSLSSSRRHCLRSFVVLIPIYYAYVYFNNNMPYDFLEVFDLT
jgi:hypothetical protein